ncbi:MAG TPA: metal ABC transporter substrate-binding protein [Planctomycetota bacterium]|jgi:ABC-type Zn uptake system ZnuABC Zn-binding protein ZnuA|nr:metal ABC transporter substrate-binding protein [Planctomycetota bacterium]
MNILHLVALSLFPAAQPAPAAAPLKVVTTLSILKDLAREVGGDLVQVESLSDPREDPHYVQPRPTLMTRAREADVFIEIGLQLELWGGKVVEGSGNPKIQSGQPGRVIASAGIPTLELPQQLSREWGDVHPFGNPHIWLDPLNAKDMAANIAQGFERVDPAHKSEYEERLKSFQTRIDNALFGEALVKEVGGRQLARRARDGGLDNWLKDKGLSDKLGGWLKRAAPLKGRPIVTYHKSQIYFAERFGLKIPIEIEEKPGIPPSARHRDAVVELIKKQGVKTILEEVFYERGAADYLAKETGAHVVVVPIDIGPDVGIATYFDLIDNVVNRLLESEGAAAGDH